MSDTLELLEATLLRGLKLSRTRLDSGPFSILWVADDSTVWMNYAMPIGPATAVDVETMIESFKSIGRTPRLEFFQDLHPGLEALLAGKGFQTDHSAPIMTMPSTVWKGSQSAIPISVAGPSDAKILLTLMNAAFGMEEANTNDTHTVQAIAEGRYLGAVASCEGVPVAGGFAVGDRRVREIAGIATLESHRRRGYGGAIIEHLLSRFFGDGGEVAWLTPGDAGAESLYTKLGFKPTGTQLIMSLPPCE